ncbi:MAG: hypothetical protein ACRD1K_11980, partial [Acidimicrobiales bacterium]
DLVNVIAGPAAGTGATNAGAIAGANAAQPFGQPATLLASRAVVAGVTDLGTQGRKFVSVKLAEADANRVAAAAERGPLRLVLVAR